MAAYISTIDVSDTWNLPLCSPVLKQYRTVVGAKAHNKPNGKHYSVNFARLQRHNWPTPCFFRFPPFLWFPLVPLRDSNA